jgi:unsaturated chondroitin disaccharide hydrolase
MKRLIALVIFLYSVPGSSQPMDVKSDINVLKHHLRNSLRKNTYPFLYPRSTNPDGSLKRVESRDWTSGFFVGNLWQMYDHTRDASWLKAAQKWNVGLEKEKDNTHTHDLGFMLYCSFGNGYRLTRNERYREILLEGARSLCTRFNSKTGCIRSWDHGKWQFPVIIDNMMNLELLFWATKTSGDSSFFNIAVIHANTTMKNHFRKDYSSYHVVDYDTATGTPIAKVTHQGNSNESAWARGQAWGLYGYTMTYRETKDKQYLEVAEKIADFYLSHPNLPDDKIPYWDFDAPAQERDASAGAIAASALLELSLYSTKGKQYFTAASEMLKSLSSGKYRARPGTNNDFFLMHCVGHKPGNSEIDVPLIYGDYYYLEALIRLEKMQRKKSIFQ